MEPSPKDQLGEHFADVVLELAPDGIAVTDELGRILYANARFERIFGVDRDLLVGHTIEVLLPDRLQASHRDQRHDWEHAPTARHMGTGRTLLGRHADGTELPLEVALSPVATGRGLRTIMTVRRVDDPVGATAERVVDLRAASGPSIDDEVLTHLYSASLALHGLAATATPDQAAGLDAAITEIHLAVRRLQQLALDTAQPGREAAHDMLFGRAGETGQGGDSGVTVEYTVDADDRLTEIGGSWAEFARDNDAPELAVPELGRSLWSYVEGDEVQDLWRRLLARVRADQCETRVPFRCDGPGVRRWFEMTISPTQDDGVQFRSVLVVESPRPDIVLLDRWVDRLADSAPLVVCSWCGRGHDGVNWRELDDVVRDRRLLEKSSVPRLDHGICPTCVALLTHGRTGAPST